MRLCVLGVPSKTADAVKQLCRTALGPEVEEALVDDDAATESFLRDRSTTAQLILSHFPREALIDWLKVSDVKTLLIVPDIYLCVTHADRIAHDSRGFLPGVLSHSLSSLAMAREIPGRLVITGREIRGELDAVLRCLTLHLPEFDVGRMEEAEKAVFRSLYDRSSLSDGESTKRTYKVTLADTRAACSGLLDLVRQGAAAELEWLPGLFFDTVSRLRPARAELDLTGPARCLFYGPYMHLPPSLWEVHVRVEILNKHGPTEFRAEIYTDQSQQDFPAILPSSGAYDVSFRFTVTDARLPIQIRLFNDRGEIEGEIRFGGARLRQLSTQSRQPERS